MKSNFSLGAKGFFLGSFDLDIKILYFVDGILATFLISFSWPIVGGLNLPKVNAISLPTASLNESISSSVILSSSNMSFSFL